jgi:hypothetical protein
MQKVYSSVSGKTLFLVLSFLYQFQRKEQMRLNTKEREVSIETLGEIEIKNFSNDEQSTFYSTLIVRLLDLYESNY